MSDGKLFDLGDVAEIFGEFKVKRTGALFDPGTLSMIVTRPDATTYTIVYPDANLIRDAIGEFRGLVPCTQVGRYCVVWVGTGPDGANQVKFDVRARC